MERRQSRFAQLSAFTLPPTGDRLGDKPLAAITEDDLEVAVIALRTNGRSTSTRNHYVRLLKKAFRWATRKGHLRRNPDLGRVVAEVREAGAASSTPGPDVVDANGRLVTAGEERRLLAVAHRACRT